MPVRFIKGFWQQKLVAVYELTGIGGLFFSWEEKLRLNQLSIHLADYFNDSKVIVMEQNDDAIDITPDMVDIVCTELQKLKNEIIKNQESK